MTYIYKLYTFENGLGERVYRIKYRGGWWHLWSWTWLEYDLCMNSIPVQWSSREAAMKGIRAHAEKRRAKIRDRETDAKRADLKLIVIEEVEG